MQKGRWGSALLSYEVFRSGLGRRILIWCIALPHPYSKLGKAGSSELSNPRRCQLSRACIDLMHMTSQRVTSLCKYTVRHFEWQDRPTSSVWIYAPAYPASLQSTREVLGRGEEWLRAVVLSVAPIVITKVVD